MKRIFYSIIGIIALSSVMFSQIEGIKAALAAGEVSEVSAAERKLTLQTKDGAIDVLLADTTSYKRVPPENPNPAAAVPSSLAEIGAGDKLLVSGKVAEDRKSMAAKTVYIITKSDISKRQQSEAQKWQARGISGKVTALNAATNEITIAVKSLMGERAVVLTPTEKIIFRRYAPNSIKFSDAKISNFGELKVDDQVRAIGERSADGLKFAAEEVLSGSFRILAGKISAIDSANNEVTIKDLSQKDATIILRADSLIKRFPAEMAQMMAGRMAGGGPQPPAGGNATVRPPNQPAGPPPSGMPQAGGPPRAGGRGDFDEMVERLPNVGISDLKVGDAIAVVSASAASEPKIVAIKMLSGIEPFLNAPQPQGGQPGRGRGGVNSNFSIPGLDGFGGP